VLATVSTCDDCVESVSLPFTFTHMGNGYSSVTVSSNGNLQFSGASTAFGNVDIPNTAVPNDMLAPAWDDYDTDEASAGQGTVYFLDDSAANNRVIISWQDCSQYDLPGLDANSFQVILYGNGNAEFRYGAMNNILNPSIAGDTVTIGYESFDGSFGGQYDSLTVGGGNTSVVLTGGVVPGPCSAACDTIDFNGDSRSRMCRTSATSSSCSAKPHRHAVRGHRLQQRRPVPGYVGHLGPDQRFWRW
jgi:hypothetical protein